MRPEFTRQPIATYSIIQNGGQNDVAFKDRIYTLKIDGEIFEGTHAECLERMKFGTNSDCPLRRY